MKKAFIRSAPAFVGLLIVIFIGSQLSSSTYHNSLTRYGAPVCSLDRHVFEDAVCAECGAEVVDKGVFFSVGVATENPYSDDYQLTFTDFYESWDAFVADYSMCLSYSNAILAVLVLEIFTYVVLFVHSHKSGKPRIGGRLK